MPPRVGEVVRTRMRYGPVKWVQRCACTAFMSSDEYPVCNRCKAQYRPFADGFHMVVSVG